MIAPLTASGLLHQMSRQHLPTLLLREHMLLVVLLQKTPPISIQGSRSIREMLVFSALILLDVLKVTGGGQDQMMGSAVGKARLTLLAVDGQHNQPLGQLPSNFLFWNHRRGPS